MEKYRKKPVVIEAIQFDGGNLGEVLNALYGNEENPDRRYIVGTDGGLAIKTLQGTMLAKPGDWVIRGVKGDLYPCKPAVFDLTYEKVEEKTLHNTDVDGAKKNVSDLEVYGNGDLFQLLSKASSKSEGWMKSTKAMQTKGGMLVQVTTQQQNPDGSYAIAEALTYVPQAVVKDYTP